MYNGVTKGVYLTIVLPGHSHIPYEKVNLVSGADRKQVEGTVMLS